MAKITKITARQILDSRGNPSLEVDVHTNHGTYGRASVASGCSKGKHEALELRDKNHKHYHGQGLLKAIKNIHEIIAPQLKNTNITEQKHIDKTLLELDGTANKSNLGANTTLAVSLASCRAGATSLSLPLYKYLAGSDKTHILPIPMANIINGGAHANNSLSCQEFMIMPLGAGTYSEAVRWISETFHTLRNILQERNYSIAVGDEGGFAPDLESDEHAIELILTAIEQSGRRPGEDISLALDIAANSFYNPHKQHYTLSTRDKDFHSTDELISWYKHLQRNYPIISIEDGITEDDWRGWEKLSKEFCPRIQIVGDDLFTTNPKRLKDGIKRKVANAILIKPNQIGTLSETIETIELATQHDYKSIISHRSGETEDTFIADIAIAFNTGQIKMGSPCRTDRTSKYNRLLRIEEQLGAQSTFSTWPQRPERTQQVFEHTKN